MLLRGLVIAAAVAAQEHSYTPADIENGSRLLSIELRRLPRSRTATWCRASICCAVSSAAPRRDVEIIRIIQVRHSGHDDAAEQLHGDAGGQRSSRFCGGGARHPVAAAARRDARASRAATWRRAAAIFAGKGECATCHRVNGTGPRVAPDLTDIGDDPASRRSCRRSCSIRTRYVRPGEPVRRRR